MENRIYDGHLPDDEAQEETETVNIIASGYEWICPECNELNKDIQYEFGRKVTCWNCRKQYETDLPEHAYG